jgi:acetoin utilization deacetylase AcuC-like enzyme
VRAFAHDVHLYPLPPGHRFPLPKYRLVREGVARNPAVRIEPARRARWSELRRAHTQSYLARVRAGAFERRELLALGLPWSEQLVERARHATGATMQAAEAALEDGVAANLGGGTHHAFADSGRGFCVVNDVVVAIHGVRPRLPRGRVLVVDLDVHQGDGTHSLLLEDTDAFTFSVNGFRNYPFKRVPGDLELDLPDGTEDERYLDGVARLLPQAIARSRPELCFYLAGADPYAGDRLGRLSLSRDGLAARDRLVRDTLAAAGIPVCVTLAGGYAEPISDTVAINVETIRVFSASR